MSAIKRVLKILVFCLLISACSSDANTDGANRDSNDVTGHQSRNLAKQERGFDNRIDRKASKLKGVWSIKGYNTIIEFDQDNYSLYELTTISCIKSGAAPIAEFIGTSDFLKFNDNETLVIKLLGNLTIFKLKKRSELPLLCQNGGTNKTDQAILNFDVLWHTFEENYAFFQLRETDWDAQYAIYRPQVNEYTALSELFGIFTQMLQPLNDSHISLSSDNNAFSSGKTLEIINKWWSEFVTQTEVATFGEYLSIQINKVLGTIQQVYLREDLHYEANNKVFWGRIANKIGYVYLQSMEGFTQEPTTIANDLEQLDNVLDSLMEAFENMDAVIIDLRMNPGGYDEAAMRIANRFADHERLAFTKKTIAANASATPQKIYLRPEGDVQFNKPVVLLTSQMTASAAEVLVLSMKTLPFVSIVGEPTNGIFSDAFTRTLPNGWSFSLSNEIYQAKDGNIYEGVGISPDIQVSFASKEDRDGNRDSALEIALEMLKNQVFK
jgi:carboxyl-terminal processing protease